MLPDSAMEQDNDSIDNIHEGGQVYTILVFTILGFLVFTILLTWCLPTVNSTKSRNFTIACYAQQTEKSRAAASFFSLYLAFLTYSANR